MAYRNGTYVAFHAAGTNLPGKSDMDYYNLMKAWTAKTDDDFTMINSHEKASAVRDASLRRTLRNSLLERLRNSKNMVLVIIAAYTVYDKPIRNPRALSAFWPSTLEVRINNETANVIHIPFKKDALSAAISQFSHASPPNGNGLGTYDDASYKFFGIEG
jgi:hypothetical protein